MSVDDRFDRVVGDWAIFDRAVSDWKAHCQTVQHHSDPLSFECDAYRAIISMGRKALPLIHSVYSGPDENAFFSSLPWASVVREIVGDAFTMPAECEGHDKPMRDHTIAWLDANMRKYV